MIGGRVGPALCSTFLSGPTNITTRQGSNLITATNIKSPMSKLTVIIAPNPKFRQEEHGLYGVTIGNEPGGGANPAPLYNRQELQKKLNEFGLTADHVKDLIERLETNHESVKFEVDTKPEKS